MWSRICLRFWSTCSNNQRCVLSPYVLIYILCFYSFDCLLFVYFQLHVWQCQFVFGLVSLKVHLECFASLFSTTDYSTQYLFALLTNSLIPYYTEISTNSTFYFRNKPLLKYFYSYYTSVRSFCKRKKIQHLLYTSILEIIHVGLTCQRANFHHS